MEVDHPKNTQPIIYKQLVNDIAEGDTIAMVGAGSSRRMGYPDWDKLLELLSAEATKINTSQKDTLVSLRQEDPLVCAGKIKEILGTEKFYLRLKEIFGPDKPKYDTFHELLVGLPFSHFLTTNYDRILQVAHEGCLTSQYTELNLEDHKKDGNLFDSICSRNAPRHYIHVHGSIRYPKSILLAYEDYEKRYKQRPDFVEILKVIFTRKLIFIGFSLQDEDFMEPLRYLTALLGTGGEPRHFAILPEQDTEGENSAVREICRTKYCVEPLFYNPSNDHSSLMPFLKELQVDVEIRRKELTSENVEFIETLTEDKLESADVFRAIQNLKSSLVLASGSNQIDTTSPDADIRTPLDSEIDNIFLHVKSGHPEIAIEMYKAILKREEYSLSERLKYRLHANIGNALNSMYRHKDASKEYLIATDYWDKTKDSHALRAMGYNLNIEHKKANEIIEKICKEYPDFPRGHALRLQSLPKGFPFKDARKSVPPKLRRNPEVALALSDIAYKQGFQRRSEVYSRIAWVSSPDWIEAGLSYATAILISEKDNAIVCGGTKLIPRNKERLKEADAILTSLLVKLQESDPAKRKGMIFYNRASVRRLLGQDSDARSDIEEAYHYERNSPETIGAYALQCELDKNRDKAIQILEQYEDCQKHANLSFLLSNMLFQRSVQDDLARALSTLMPWCEEIDKVTPASHRYDFFRLISEILLKLNRAEDAVGLVDKIPDLAMPPSYKRLLLLWIKIESKAIDLSEAKRICEEVANALGSNAEYYITRDIALFADKIEHYPISFDLWKKITIPQSFNPDTNSLLRAAKNTQKHEFIIDFCTQLRQNGIHERNGYISEIEANIGCHEFNEALKLMVAWLSHEPEDKEMRMNLSLLASEIGEVQYVEGDPDKLPAITEVPNAVYGTRVVQALSQSVSANAAIEYAYELWRKFPDEITAQHTLISTVFTSEKDETALVEPTEVECGSAVMIKVADSGKSRTHIIENGPSPSMARNEYSPNHEISKLLLKKKIGDLILVNGKKWSILEIHNKYQYVASKLLQSFCMEFPQNQLLREFHVPIKTDPSIDPQEALGEVRAFMQDEETRKKTFEDLYQKGSLPVVSFAKLLGKSVLETMMYLAASSNHKIRVCSSISGEFDFALKKLTRECKIVLDETAIATLFMLGIYKDLQQLPYELIISESLIYEIRKVVKHAVSSKRSNLYLGISDGKLVTHKVSPTEHANWINSLEELLISLQKNCTIEGGKSLLDIKPSERENLIQIFGAANADAIAIAKQSRAIYWTDDFLSGGFASNWKIQHVWSQVALQYVKDIDRGFIAAYNKAEKNLFLWGYEFTAVHVHTIISIFIDAKWNLKDFRLRYTEEFIGRVGAVNKMNCITTCLLLIEIWQKAPKRKNACEIIIQLLEKIGRDFSGPYIARLIYRHQIKLPNSPKIRSLKRMLRAWRSNPNKIMW